MEKIADARGTFAGEVSGDDFRVITRAVDVVPHLAPIVRRVRTLFVVPVVVLALRRAMSTHFAGLEERRALISLGFDTPGTEY
jgi:hypothetical protein